MADKTTINRRNTWAAKLKRTFTSILPVAKNRRGRCLRCGACCRLPNVCPWLAFDDQNKAVCIIYPVRPLNCRKYPRTESELITEDTCGHFFEKSPSE
jgi:Fe-S-cluster containining protein